MNLLRYRKIEPYEFRNILDQYIGLTDYQKSKMMDIDWYPFTIIKYEEPEPVKPIWRLTILFYWLYILFIVLFVTPVKWMIEGNRCFSEKDRLSRIYVYWTKKLGFT